MGILKACHTSKLQLASSFLDNHLRVARERIRRQNQAGSGSCGEESVNWSPEEEGCTRNPWGLAALLGSLPGLLFTEGRPQAGAGRLSRNPQSVSGAQPGLSTPHCADSEGSWGGALGAWKALSLETFQERKEHFPWWGVSLTELNAGL